MGKKASLVCVDNDSDKPLATFQINNRRYLGNKYKLLSEIRRIVKERCLGAHTFLDIFAGTGSVASAFPEMRILTNDILYSNYITHIAWFSGESYSAEKIAGILSSYNAASVVKDNYMSENFSDTYFSRADCRKIGYVREDIENRSKKGEINEREKALLVTSLLYAMDKIANTVGHYDAYRKGASFDKHLELRMPVPPKCHHADNACYNEDANELALRLSADIVFMDPPYNSRQYGDAYHLLENVARWKKPPVYGVARKMDRDDVKSEYCTRDAEAAFAELVGRINARYIVLTYNNMADKGNDRSNAKLSDAAIMRTLEAKGKVSVFHVSHKAFSTGKSDRDDNEERIFLCECRKTDLIASPLNYTGGKFRLLEQLLPNFPTNIRVCVDLFCGGGNVGVNVSAREVRMYDSCHPLIDLFGTMRAMPQKRFVEAVDDLIRDYGFSNTDEMGYAAYGCTSSDGLASYNKNAYLRLREHYAQMTDGTQEKSVALYVLIVFGFNNQIRFNGKGEFNLPVGKRDFNARMRNKLTTFLERMNAGSFLLASKDFRQLECNDLGAEDFVYADPPYLVTTASYNENGGWTEKDERDLLEMLDRLHERGCRFALSNVLESQGRRNTLLQEWLARNVDRYRAIEVNSTYVNANYQRKDIGRSREVLVVNY